MTGWELKILMPDMAFNLFYHWTSVTEPIGLGLGGGVTSTHARHGVWGCGDMAPPTCTVPYPALGEEALLGFLHPPNNM